MNSNSDFSSQRSDQGSFINGFTVGLLAGAVGYFLFATDRGEKVRASLKTEFEAAQKKLVKTGEAGKPLKVSLRELVKEAVDEVAKRTGFAEEKKPAAKKAKSKTADKKTAA